MDELIRWTDNAPTLRCYEVRFDGSQTHTYRVRVWGKDGRTGQATGCSLNFAAVKAIIAYEASEAAP